MLSDPGKEFTLAVTSVLAVYRLLYSSNLIAFIYLGIDLNMVSGQGIPLSSYLPFFVFNPPFIHRSLQDAF
jgi:hypothetical protein